MLYIHHNSGNFEWTATMLNINKGHNRDIMNKSQALSEYSDFVSKVKEYSHTMPIKEAIDLAVGYAISHNYLDGFFKKHREGIMLSCLTEFNEEVFIAVMTSSLEKSNNSIISSIVLPFA